MKQRFLVALSMLMLASLLVSPLSVSAQGRKPGQLHRNNDPDTRYTRTSEADAAADFEAAAVRHFRERLASRSGPVAVFVELDGPTVLQATSQARTTGATPDAATTTGQRQLGRLRSLQASAISRIRAIDSGSSVLFQTQRVANGIALRIDASKLRELFTVPGVKRVSRLPSYTLDNATSVPLIGAPSVWSGFTGVDGSTGEGISIGIVDTGIDYHHTGFGGPGGGYNTNDTTVITDAASLAYFGANALKVKGGYDFAGDAYDGDNDPAPDPDPMDCLDPTAPTVGHGTHVAGTAAGFGVNADGTRYAGPYGTGTNFGNLRIGPGVAPGADLYALRVFGCDGSTNLVIAALEWATDPNGDGNTSDHLDVVNLSLGSDFGRADDPDALAADAASAAGVIVVFSAGNSGNTTYVSGSPGSSSSAITVASSDDGVDVVDGFRVNTPAGIAGVKPASFSAAYNWAARPDVSGDLVYINAPGKSTGCNVPGPNNTTVSPYAANELLGKVVLVDWAAPGESDNFYCGSVQRSTNAANAGAVGIIMASGVPYFDTAITGSPLIPAVFTTFTVGAQLKTALGSGTVNVTFSNQYLNSQRFVVPELEDTLSGFSSRGPRGGDSALKPDIAAPGQSIFSVDFNSGNAGKTLSGTSMAAPHIAGVMALLRELNPELSVAELKALVMNTAVQDVYGFENSTTPLHSVQRVGTGRVDVPRAAAGKVIAYDSQRPDLVSVSFGAVEVVTATTLTRTVTVENLGTAAKSYTVSFTPDSTIPGVSYTVSPGSISVAAGATATLTVVMSANPAQMRHISDELVEPVQGSVPGPLPRHFIAEAAGTIDLYETAPTAFFADASGRNEVPPVASNTFASVGLTSTGGGNYNYSVTFSSNITIAASHLHRGVAGTNGPVAVNLLAGGSYNGGQAYTGSVTLSEADQALLLAGGLYANFHTAANPGGEIRGQVVADQTPDLRLGVYATARAASTMSAAPDVLDFGQTLTGTKELTFSGVGHSTGQNLPLDLLSVATLFELQTVSENDAADFGEDLESFAEEVDISHVGVGSTFGPNTSVLSSTLFFAVATHANWSTPNSVEFDIYIDTDDSGIDPETGDGAEYVLFNWSTGYLSSPDGNDVFVTLLINLETGDGEVVELVNYAPASLADTQPFNTNVLILPVPAADLGLTANASKINYEIVTFSAYVPGVVDFVGGLSYDLAKPGVTFSSAAGIPGLPAVADLPGTKVTVGYNRANFLANDSEGALIMHHHNTTGTRVEAVDFTVIRPEVWMPIIRR